MEKFKNRYRVASSRLSSWNYGWNASYFVTVCTKNRECYFGKIENDTMKLSDLGKVAVLCWKCIPDHFPFVRLGPWIVMPNHIHGIIAIDKNESIAVITNKFGPQERNLSSIIRGFKIGVTKAARKLDLNFAWQPRFHDHIVRNQESFDYISEYIKNNPRNWDKDKLNDTNNM
jgi:putative transposase